MIAFLLYISCADTDSDTADSNDHLPNADLELSSLLSEEGECTVLEDLVLNTPTDSLSHLAPHLMLYRVDDTVGLFDAAAKTFTDLGSFQYFDGRIIDDSMMLMALDGEVYTYNDEVLTPSPLETLLPVPIRHLDVHQKDIWLWGAGELFRWSDDLLYQVDVGGLNILDVVFSSSHIYISTPSLQILELQDNSVDVIDVIEVRNDINPTVMVTNKAGDLWVSTGENTLHRRDVHSQWTTFTLESSGDIDSLMGHPLSSKSWIQSGSDAWVLEHNALCRVTIEDGEWLSVDALGRLLIQTSEGVQRVSVDRPVAVVNLLYGETLDIQKEVQFLPTGLETLDYFSVWVDDIELVVEEEPFRTVLDPEDFMAGDHHLRLVTKGAEGTTIGEYPFVTDVLPSTTWDDVEPILLNNCINCHQEDALLPLNNKERWETYIEQIISEVSAQTMPLGGTPLSNDDILTIRGWKQGGFQ